MERSILEILPLQFLFKPHTGIKVKVVGRFIKEE